MTIRVHRAKRLRWAVASSLLSKAAGSVAQLLTLPLIAHGLGAPRYGAYLALTASIAWTGLLSFGLRPALTRLIAQARANEDFEAEWRLISAAVGFTFAIMVLLVAATLVAAEHVDVRVLVGAGPQVPQEEIRLGLFTVMAVVAVHFFGATSIAIGAGYQESYVSNLLSFAANLAIIAGAVVAAAHGAGIWGWVLVLYLPFAALFLTDLVFLVTRRTKQIRSFRLFAKSDATLRSLIAVSGAASGVQIHYFLTAFGTVILVSHLYGVANTVAFGSLMRGTILAAGVISIFVLPSLPALTDAVTRNDIAWVRFCYRRLMSMTLIASTTVALAVALFGSKIINFWLGGAVHVSPLMCIGFSIYLLFSMLNSTGFNIALALGTVKGVGWQFLAEAALVYLIVAALRDTRWLPRAEGRRGCACGCSYIHQQLVAPTANRATNPQP